MVAVRPLLSLLMNRSTESDEYWPTAVTHRDGLTVDLGCAQVHGWKEGNPIRKVMEGFGIVRPLSLALASWLRTLTASQTAHVVEGAQLLVVGDQGSRAAPFAHSPAN